uniref:Uncharacterized protein n=2 Tax=Lygus hesperus TaxID=30085 RepID=A0A146KYS3_LYGHE
MWATRINKILKKCIKKKKLQCRRRNKGDGRVARAEEGAVETNAGVARSPLQITRRERIDSTTSGYSDRYNLHRSVHSTARSSGGIADLAASNNTRKVLHSPHEALTSRVVRTRVSSRRHEIDELGYGSAQREGVEGSRVHRHRYSVGGRMDAEGQFEQMVYLTRNILVEARVEEVQHNPSDGAPQFTILTAPVDQLPPQLRGLGCLEPRRCEGKSRWPTSVLGVRS